MDDKDLIELIKNGDKNAFALLVKKYKEFGFSLSLKIVENHEDAEEVMQDAFMKVYKGIKLFRGDSKFSTWFYKIIFNTSITFKEKKSKNDKIVDLTTFGDYNLQYENHFDSKYILKQLQNALDRLPMDERTIATLFYLQEQKISEIGIIIGISENLVKVKLFRIRKKLQKLLSNIKNEF